MTVAATDEIFCRVSSSFVHKKNFSLIWQEVFKLWYVFSREKLDTSFEFKWTRRKVASENNSW